MKLSTTVIAFITLLFCSCNGQSSKGGEPTNKEPEENNASLSLDDDNGKTGNFKVDGKDFSGKVTTQHFGDKEKGNFSVLCQEDGEKSNFALLQITFVTESDARGKRELKLHDSPMLPMTDPVPGIVAVGLTGFGEKFGDKEYSGTSKSSGTINVSNNTISLKNLKIYNQDTKEVTVDAEIPF
ncbi:MAG: hypothetical protein ABI204_11790 [Ginsengibacter sp.]